jgi:FkbM family methyltransferase
MRRPLGPGEGAGGKARRKRAKSAGRRAEDSDQAPKPRKAKARAQGPKKQARARAEGASPTGAARKAKRRRAPGEKRRAAGRETAPSVPQERPRDALNARTVLFEQVRDHAPYIGVSAAGADFIVSTGDRHVGRGLFVKQQRPEMGVLRRAVHVVEALAGEDALADSLFVDVGANIGTTTVTALVSHLFGGAVACEPDEENYRLLRANLALNGLDDRVQPLRTGVSNQNGRSSLVVMEGSGGKSWIALNPATIQADEVTREVSGARAAGHPGADRAAVSVVEVELTTLDRLVETGVVDRDRIGMLWVDAEGHEGHVLEGAGTLAEQGVPIVFEFHPAGIDARGDRSKIHALADECYTHFVDVRRPASDEGQPQLTLRGVAGLPSYAERFLSPSTPEVFTDLLLLRLTPEQVSSGASLQEQVDERRRNGGTS